jgi:hypothetical protein
MIPKKRSLKLHLSLILSKMRTQVRWMTFTSLSLMEWMFQSTQKHFRILTMKKMLSLYLKNPNKIIIL